VRLKDSKMVELRWAGQPRGGVPHWVFLREAANRAEGRLTCLSVRCLSSYLIFSASFSDKQAAVRFAGARLYGWVRRP
jgi:hypothetical protein